MSTSEYDSKRKGVGRQVDGREEKNAQQGRGLAGSRSLWSSVNAGKGQCGRKTMMGRGVTRVPIPPESLKTPQLSSHYFIL